MTFLNPWAIWAGVGAAAIPVVVHFLTRPRPQRMPLSTLRFVREAIRDRRARHHLRDAVILSLRTLAILLIALAIARPQFNDRSTAPDAAAGDTVRVVLLDQSASMNALSGGVAAMERARTAAAGYLRYRPGLSADLIVAGATPKAIFGRPSSNFEALRDELSRCPALPVPIDVRQALDKATAILAPTDENDRRRRELVIVSDFQRSSWSAADFSALPENTRIQFESVAAAQRPSNVAIVRAEGRPVSHRWPRRAIRGRRVELRPGRAASGRRFHAWGCVVAARGRLSGRRHHDAHTAGRTARGGLAVRTGEAGRRGRRPRTRQRSPPSPCMSARKSSLPCLRGKAKSSGRRRAITSSARWRRPRARRPVVCAWCESIP